MRKTIFRRIVFAVTGCLLFTGCPNSSEKSPSGASTNILTNMSTNTTIPPTFSGFALPLQTGSFWQFSYDLTESSYAQGSSGSSASQKGTFRIILGQPSTFKAKKLYSTSLIHLSGSGATIPFRWKYIGIDGNRIIGSIDGSAVQAIFDAQTGSQAGGGFFATFGASTLVQATNGTVPTSNTYVSGSAVSLAESYDQNSCQYFSDYGTICGGESDTDKSISEYFKAGQGPFAYYYRLAYMYSGGGFTSGGSTEWNIGQTGYSFAGDGLYQRPQVSTLTTGDVAIYYGLYDAGVTLRTDPYGVATPSSQATTVMRYLPATNTAEAVTPTVDSNSTLSYAILTDNGELQELLSLGSGSTGSIFVRAVNPRTGEPRDSVQTKLSSGVDWFSLKGLSRVNNQYVFIVNGTSSITYRTEKQTVGSSTVSSGGSNGDWRELFSTGSVLYGGLLSSMVTIQGTTFVSQDYYKLIDLTQSLTSPTTLNYYVFPALRISSVWSRDFAVDDNSFYFAITYSATGLVEVYKGGKVSSTQSDQAVKIFSTAVSGVEPRTQIDADGGYVVINVVTKSPVASKTYLYSPVTGGVIELNLPGNGIKLNTQIIKIQ